MLKLNKFIKIKSNFLIIITACLVSQINFMNGSHKDQNTKDDSAKKMALVKLAQKSGSDSALSFTGLNRDLVEIILEYIKNSYFLRRSWTLDNGVDGVVFPADFINPEDLKWVHVYLSNRVLVNGIFQKISETRKVKCLFCDSEANERLLRPESGFPNSEFDVTEYWKESAKNIANCMEVGFPFKRYYVRPPHLNINPISVSKTNKYKTEASIGGQLTFTNNITKESFNLNTQGRTTAYKGLSYPFPCFSDDEKYLVISRHNGPSIELFDIELKRFIKSFKINNIASDITISNDNKYIVAGLSNGYIIVIDVVTDIQNIFGYTIGDDTTLNEIRHIEISPNLKYIVASVGEEKKKIQLWYNLAQALRISPPL